MNLNSTETILNAPYINVCANTLCCWEGWEAIIAQINNKVAENGLKKTLVCIECYPGTYESVNLKAIKEGLAPSAICLTRDLLKEEKEIRNMVGTFVPENDIFGRISGLRILDFYQHKKKQSIQDNIDQIDSGIILVFGVAASLLFKADITVYADMSLYEIQQRFRRKDISNFAISNEEENYEKQYTRGFFIDWYLGNKIKKSVFSKADFVLDTNNWQKPKMVAGESLREGFFKASQTPFIQAPFFDPEIWDNPNALKDKEDFYWYFNCIPEENSILFKFNDILFESPVVNAIYLYPKAFLGNTVYHLFGAELPIRMNFIDNLDTENDDFMLTVYPDTEEIKDLFGCNYITENSYYIMATGEHANIHIGHKKQLDKKEIKKIIGKKTLIFKQFFNEIPLKQHDQINIPAGLPHSFGNNCVLLKVGISPEFLSYKLWQHQKTEIAFDEIFLNLHKQRGVEAIDEQASIFPKQLSNQVEVLDYGEHWREEKLGGNLYNLLEQRRHIFSSHVKHFNNGNVEVINLVQGEKIIVESEERLFDSFVVYYSQTFIVPASVKGYTIRPANDGEECITLKAFIKH